MNNQIGFRVFSYHFYYFPGLLVSFLVLLSSCRSNHYLQHVGEYEFRSKENLPEYSNLNYWAANPYKWDPSDSIPKTLREKTKDSSVDVFFIYPTTYTDRSKLTDQPNGGSLWNARIDDDSINAKTDYTTILFQASAFNHYRVFAPRYRQAHIRSFFIPDTISRPFFEIAYQDIKTAFEYYMANYNLGRPFIIASHSQGTFHAARLLKEYVENKPLHKKMIAAYLIGMPIREGLFTTIAPCRDSTATGCFISWRTFKDGNVDSFVLKENYKVAVTNPLSWNTNDTPVNRKQNRGSILYNFNAVKKHNVGAQVHGNVLWTSKPRFFGNVFLRSTNYHIADINLFWKNIRDNVDTRVNMYKMRSIP